MGRLLTPATHALNSFGEILGRRIEFIVFDELDDILRRVKRDWVEHDRSHYHRGGRYRRPPTTSKFERPPGARMARVRDRTGKLVWKDMSLPMDRHPLFGSF